MYTFLSVVPSPDTRHEQRLWITCVKNLVETVKQLHMFDIFTVDLLRLRMFEFVCVTLFLIHKIIYGIC